MKLRLIKDNELDRFIGDHGEGIFEFEKIMEV